MSHQLPRIVRRGFLSALLLICFAVVALVWGVARSTKASLLTANSAAANAAQSCPTCPREPVALTRFRTAVGGDVTPVLVELKGDPASVRRYIAEKQKRPMTIAAISRHSLSLYSKQTDFYRTLSSRGVRALLREQDTRQPDGSIRHVTYRFTYLLNGFVAFVATSDLPRLRALPEVSAVSELHAPTFMLDKAIDYSLGTQANPADRRTAVYGATQEFRPVGSAGHPETPQTRAQKADGFEGQDLNIAVIDSGIDYRHPMFGGTGQTTPLPRISGNAESPNDNKKVIYYYALSSPGDITDDFGHGTLVASNAAGFIVDGNTPANLGFGTGTTGLGAGPTPGGRIFFGTAPQARIMSYKVCGPAPQCAGDTELSMEDAASPVTLVGQGDGGSMPTMVPKPVADVINLSLGDTAGDPTGASSRAANNAALAGTIVVASAGNSGPGAGTIGAPSAATLAVSVAASLDPGSISGADVLAPNQIPGETRVPATPGPSPETGGTSNANAPQAGERQGIKVFPVAGGGALPVEEGNPGQPTENNTGSVSAHYVYVDLRPMGATPPASVTNRIAVTRFSNAFATAANQLAPFNPAAILLVTATESATAVAVAGGIPTFTISEADADYLLDRLSSTDDNAAEPTVGAISELPVRLAESISLAAFRGSMAGFSSRGPNDHPNARFRQIKPDVTAPGVGIQGAATVDGLPDDTVGLASATGYTVANGTSFSGPITAGAITLVRQRVREELGFDSINLNDPQYRSKRFNTVTVARALLMNTATNLRSGVGVPEGGRNASTTINDLGAGHINVAGALRAKAIMVAPTRLLAANGGSAAEFTRPTGADAPPDSDFDAAGNLRVLIPSASFGSVPVAGIAATVVRTQELIIRDVTNGAGGGTYQLTVNNNRNIDDPGFGVITTATANSTTPITSINVPANGQASFFVRVSANGEQVTTEGKEFQWYVSATPGGNNERLRVPFYFRAARAALGIVTAPNQAAVENTNGGAAECVADTDGNYRLRFAYTQPTGGQNPVGFRIQEATRTEEKFFDNADEPLVAGANSKWTGSAQWTSQTNPTTGSLAYFVPDAAMQDESLAMVEPITLASGGATMTFDTTQDFEENFDYGYVEATRDGTNFETVASFTGTFTGTRAVDLSEFAGGAVQIRFRIASDLVNTDAEMGWYVENIRVSSDDFKTIGLVNNPAATSFDVINRASGTYLYRIAALFAAEEGNATGPFSNTRCVAVTRQDQLALDDAYVRGATPTTNFGSTPDLQVKRTLNPGSGKGRRAFLKFDTSGTTSVTDATRFIVRVTGRMSDASVSNIPAAIFSVPDTSWQEETITWNNQPSVSSPNPLSTVIITDTTERIYDFDVTDYVKSERAAGRNIVGFVIRNQERTGQGDVFTRFNSKEAPGNNNRPMLITQQP